jgi:hypothetical protein
MCLQHKLTWGLRVAALFILCACNETILKNTGADRSIDPLSCGDTPISYASVNEHIFIRNCTVNGCHSGNGLNLTTYEGVHNALPAIKGAVLSNKMPPAGPLPFEDKVLLLSWINQGGPRNAEDANMNCSNENPPPPPPPGLQPTYVSLREKVLAQNCLLCHNSEHPDPEHPIGDFSSYEAMTSPANMHIFDMHEPSNSELIRRVSSTDPAVVMPPPDSLLEPLPAEVIAVMKEWIAKGVPKE